MGVDDFRRSVRTVISAPLLGLPIYRAPPRGTEWDSQPQKLTLRVMVSSVTCWGRHRQLVRGTLRGVGGDNDHVSLP
jgi:hypothetical protein